MQDRETALKEVEIAERIARKAHAGQVDRVNGRPYIEHVERVVAMVEGDEAKAAAWLHDVLEDSEETPESLEAAGISPRVILAVRHLTRYEPRLYGPYIDRLRAGQVAAQVKVADLRDHLTPSCPESLRPRYEAALALLAYPLQGHPTVASPQATLFTMHPDGFRSVERPDRHIPFGASSSMAHAIASCLRHHGQDGVGEQPTVCSRAVEDSGSFSTGQQSGASPQAETRRDCTCLGTCRGAEGLGPRWKCALETPAPVSPQEPTGASPQAEELRAANVANLREMVGMAGRHRETLLAVRECILALSPGHRTGYDWNADPLYMTRYVGDALKAIDAGLKSLNGQAAVPTYRNVYIVTHYPDGGLRGVHASQAGAEAEIADLCREYPEYSRRDFSITCGRIRPFVEPAGASEPPCPHCKLPRVLPEECTPALGAVIDAQIAERWDVLNHGIDLGQQFAAEKAGASEPPRRFVDPEPECPGADCSRCSGEYCDVHITDPCDCDTAERHASDIGKPAPVSPVEPEPPTEAQFGEYDRLKRQAREIEKALREAGCPAMPLEQGVRWLADKDFTAPLPPRPPAVVKPHRYDLVRYGVTWEGQSNQPLLTPMPDGYWTPWHLAVEAPTVEPEPCVWRDNPLFNQPTAEPSCRSAKGYEVEMAYLNDFTFCPYCLKPLRLVPRKER